MRGGGGGRNDCVQTDLRCMHNRVLLLGHFIRRKYPHHNGVGMARQSEAEVKVPH